MQVTPSQMRGQVSAVYLFTMNLIGLGAGPTAVALVTDHVFHNDNLVGSSLLVVGIAAKILSLRTCMVNTREVGTQTPRKSFYTGQSFNEVLRSAKSSLSDGQAFIFSFRSKFLTWKSPRSPV